MTRLLAAAVIAAVLAVIVFVGWWFFLAAQARSAMDAWVAERRDEGWTVDYAGPETGGFPAHVRMTLRDVVLIPPDPEAGWQWRAPEVVAQAAPLAPQRITVRPAGVQQVDLGPAATPLRLEVSAREMVAVVDVTAAPAITVESFADAAVIAAASGDRVTIGRIDARGARLKGETAPSTPRTALTVTATDIALPEGSDPPFGRGIARLAVDGTLVGALDPGAGAAGLLRWRDEGGLLDIASLEINSGPVEARATGRIALDGNGQPQAALATRIRGLIDALEALRDRGLVGDGAFATARLVLTALSRTPADGGRPEVAVDIAVENRVVSLGPVPLVTLPPILWP